MSRTTEIGDDVAFAITADSGELETQAVLLTRSLRKYYPTAPLLVFVPEMSIESMNEDALEYLGSVATLTTGELPIVEYPISALIKAFVEAEREFDAEYFVALDTDTLVLDHLRVTPGHDVWLRPADVGAQYWGSKDACADWRDLYRRFGYSLPDPQDRLTASVDRRTIPPYWNSGVVVTTDRMLPSRWLEYTRRIFDEKNVPLPRDQFFTDQVSLALAVRENDVGKLTERENFPLGGRLLVPNDIAVLHYGSRRNLTRVLNSHIREYLNQIDAIPPLSLRDLLCSLLVVASTKSGYLLPYNKKELVRQGIKRLSLERDG